MSTAHSRHSIRKPEYDYSQAGFYFLTICTYLKRSLFGEVQNGKVILNDIARVVQEEWNRAIDVRPGLKLDAFIIMPNHLHGILVLPDKWATHRVAPTNQMLGPKSGSIGAIVGQFKSSVSKRTAIRSIWQRNYYDRIIRTERELNLTRLYILANPLMWNWDPNNTDGEVSTSIDDGLIKQCGFSPEDYELIRNYMEYRKMR